MGEGIILQGYSGMKDNGVEKMKIKNLSDDFYNEEIRQILVEKNLIDDEDVFMGFNFDDMTFESVEELNQFIDDHCICLSDDEYTYFVYRRSDIGEKTGNAEFPNDYNVERVKNEDTYMPDE